LPRTGRRGEPAPKRRLTQRVEELAGQQRLELTADPARANRLSATATEPLVKVTSL